MDNDRPLWTPPVQSVKESLLYAFIELASRTSSQTLSNYRDLHRWSLECPADFWALVWDFCGIVGQRGERVIEDGDRMPGAQFFPDGRLNFAENLLRKSGADDALVFRGEDRTQRRMSWDELHRQVSRVQQMLIDHGVKPGDRVAAMMPNMPETVVAMLATVSLGAIWSSCSPDFGEQGVLDRFGQIEPAILFAPDGYWYNGKHIDIEEKLAAIIEKLPSVRCAFIVAYTGRGSELAERCNRVIPLSAALARYEAQPLQFLQLPFSHPLYILYSSGTTGVPKCIVHSAGGVLVKHLTEHKLNSGVRPGDRFFHFTTCGWMMWNWMTSALASEATLLLYDGSPTYPDESVLFEFAEQERATYFGTSAKFIDLLRKSGLRLSDKYALAHLRMMSSTGSPLSVDCFKFVYDAIKKDMHLASIAGGTDAVGSFLQGIPDEPVWAGEIQGPALGMATVIFDEYGHSVEMTKGELVCRQSFPTMPLKFWNDPDDRKYRAAYFEKYPGVWCQGDFAATTHHRGVVIYGRSDATLNPGGVRIGTAEIYRIVDVLPEVIESICVGQEWNDDIRVILFVRLNDQYELSDELKDRMRSSIRKGASPRHVPAKIIAVPDIPRTKSGKLTELAVRELIHGRPVKNIEAMANSDSLRHFHDLEELSR